jgi:hypothetical protein
MDFLIPLILCLLFFLVTVVVDGVAERGADEAAAPFEPVFGEEGLGGNGVADGGADEAAASVSSSFM